MKIKLFNEVRLTAINWCFTLALKLAPKSKEGLIVIGAIHQLTAELIRHYDDNLQAKL